MNLYNISIFFLAISPFLQDVLKIIVGFIFGGFGLAVYHKMTGKKKEALEVANLSADGENLVIQLKTNIDKIVAEKTKSLNDQITELNGTILSISVKYKRDLDQYVERMASLEERIDTQSERTSKAEVRTDEAEKRNLDLERNLESEIILRKACIAQLRNLQERVYELEKISNPVSNQQINNPNNPDNTLTIDDLRH